MTVGEYKLSEFQQFDELYVVSDLHIGGARGFQIFRQPALLAGLIRSLAGVASEGTALPVGPPTVLSESAALDYVDLPAADRNVALLLNGDVVDFLAEANAEPLSISSGPDKLLGIVQREEFACVFSALRAYLATPNRHLVVVLGNHDIELALPGTQELLRGWLTQGNAEARGRLTFATDGSGYRCKIGNTDVLCVHGDIADDWNRIDHQGLRQVAHDWKAGQKVYDYWQPCGGTKLVLNVMNGVKAKFPFVDLLKPETEATLPILQAVDKNSLKQYLGLMSAAGTKLGAGVFRGRFLSDEDEPKAVAPEDLLDRAALELAVAADQSAARNSLEQAELDLASDLDPVQLAREEGGDELLSLGEVLRQRPASLFRKYILGKSKAETVRLSLLETLKEDRTFLLTEPDEPFKWVKKNVSSSIAFVVAGHTHLERAMERPGGGYFNSGTWASLINLRAEQMESEEAFTPVFSSLTESRSVQALEAAKLSHSRPTVVSIAATGSGGSTGQLHYAHAAADGRVRLTARPETRIHSR